MNVVIVYVKGNIMKSIDVLFIISDKGRMKLIVTIKILYHSKEIIYYRRGSEKRGERDDGFLRLSYRS